MNTTVITKSGAELRTLARSGSFTSPTTGQAPNFLQGNVTILPQDDARDFLQFCLNNPKPCPLIGLSAPGDPSVPELGDNIDIRRDVPLYRVYENGQLAYEADDIVDLWQTDLVSFVLGCSFSFEEALQQAGYSIRHIDQGRNVPMYISSIPTIAGGTFSGPMVVSMRPFRRAEIAAIYDLCAHYPHAHGAPLHFGDAKTIGIQNIDSPDFGDAVDIAADELPVFWACGVTPQVAIESSRPALCITHAPGHMLVTDIQANATPPVITGAVKLMQS